MTNAQDAAGVVSLDELFSSATRTGTGPVLASSCASDWRQVQPGDVYVALPEDGISEDDGHDHAQRAVSCGAIAVVCERPVPVFDVPTYLVSDSRVALGQLCQTLVGNPTRSIPVIAVAGTHGKTSTVALLEAIFCKAGYHPGTISNFGCYDGMAYSRGIGSCPSSLGLAKRLANMNASGCSHAFVEVSSLSLSQARFAEIEFAGVCVTNVTEANLHLHNSVQNYRETERRVLKQLSPGAVAVLNTDDAVCTTWLADMAGPVLTYGLGTQAEITARIIEQHASEQIFLLTAGNESVAVRTTLVGEHQVSNCLAAATMSLAFGIDLPTIAAGIESVSRLPDRMERIECGQEFPVYVDAADTPGALRATLRAARQISSGRVICVLSEQPHATAKTDAAVVRIAQDMADLVVLSQPLSDDRDWGNGFDGAPLQSVPDRGEAIACAVALAKSGDVVVITGSQPRSVPAFGEGDLQPSDTEITSQLLYARNEAVVRLAA